MSEIDTLYVLGASYDTKEEAEADYEAIKALYRDVAASHDFDAAVLERDDEGEVHVVKKHEQPTRHGAAKGIGWGLAVGAAAAIFPAFALGGSLLAGGAAGGIIGAVKGHMQGGMKERRPQGSRRDAREGPLRPGRGVRHEHGGSDRGEHQGGQPIRLIRDRCECR